MPCKCITNWNQKLKERFGDSASVNYALMSDGTARVVITGFYHPQKKDGSLAKNTKDVNLLPSYCPFCGQPYEETVEIPTSRNTDVTNNKPSDLDCDDYEHGTPEGGCDGMGHYLCNECKWRSQESLKRVHEDYLHGHTSRRRSKTNQYIRARVIESDEEVLVDDFDIDGIYNMWHNTENGMIYHDDELEFLDPRLQSIPNE